MKAEEFLIQQWNKCIWFNHEDYPENIVMIYDKQHERKLKLNSLNNSKDKIKFVKSNDSKIKFYQDYKYGYFEASNKEIYSVLESKYNLNYQEINELITKTLLEDNKLKQLTTSFGFNTSITSLLVDNKLKELTPTRKVFRSPHQLLEENKLKQI